MRTSKLVLDKANQVSEAYKVLKPYVKDEEYFAYINGLHQAVAILQAYEEAEQATKEAE